MLNGGNFIINSTTDNGNGKIQLQSSTASSGGIAFGTDVAIYRSAAGTIAVNGTWAPNALNVSGTTITKERHGTATLSAGAATVSDSAVTASTRIYLTSQSDGGTVGFLRVSARTAGTSFTITSSSASDTSTVAYLEVEP